MVKRPLVLRTPEMSARNRAARENFPEDYDPFDERLKERPLEDWEHWVLFENIYPYDAVADTHHILIPKRKFRLTTEMTPSEREEFEVVKSQLRDRYDSIIENFPSIQSVPARLHFHFVVWKKR